MVMKVAPSLLSCDFAHMAREIAQVTDAGADWLHIDVMDGVFVPNLSVGIPIVQAARKVSAIPLDVHLMIVKPEKYIEAFVQAGANFVTIHIEATRDVAQVLKRIRELGARAGISLRPGTPVESLSPFLELVDLVLVMTVEPGFGGQSFMPEQVHKIEWLYHTRESQQYPYLIQVDGGINAETAQACRLADSLVSGSYIFGSSHRKQAIELLRAVR
jgi:ribulose-phosphate 3-epimerase